MTPSYVSGGGGSGSQRPLGQTFKMNPSNGTMSLSLPIYTSPGRGGFGPALALSYNSGSGNGPFGLGWQMDVGAVTRKTSHAVPHYDDSDVFLLSGHEDLLPRADREPVVVDGFTIEEFLPRVVAEVLRVERWTSTRDVEDVYWRSISAENVTTVFGRTDESRVLDSHSSATTAAGGCVQQRRRIYSWLACERYDAFGNAIQYSYKAEDAEGIASLPPRLQIPEASRTAEIRARGRYLKSIYYGNRTPNRSLETWAPAEYAGEWLYRVVLDYGEHDTSNPTTDEVRPWSLRQDSFSSARCGFEIRQHRLCRRILMFHHIPEKLRRRDCLVRSTSLEYQETPVASVLVSFSEHGYRPVADASSIMTQSMPPYQFEYFQAPPAETLDVKEFDTKSLIGVPGSLSQDIQWLDLNGEGSSGLLQRHLGGAWTYQRNENAAVADDEEDEQPPNRQAEDGFGQTLRLRNQPNSGPGEMQYFEDIDLDGKLELVFLDAMNRFGGYFQRVADDDDWEQFVAFESVPSFDGRTGAAMRLDLTGNGLSDLLMMDDSTGELVWYECLGKRGFSPEQRIKPDKRNPQLVTGDAQCVVYLADMSGDGSSDIIRIAPGRVSYWPTLSRGRFGEEVVMYDAPRFDSPANFSHDRLKIADLYGNGTADLVYFPVGGGADVYFNLAGNGWSQPVSVPSFPSMDSTSSIFVLDLLGGGTSCLCWSGPDRTQGTAAALRYIDPTAGKKPLILKSVTNGMGGKVALKYKSSNWYYHQDERRGRPWRTRIGFPIQCVSQVKISDAVTGACMQSRYAYHDGYYDRVDKEFRGFGVVEQWDAEVFRPLKRNLFRTPPVLTKTWFHTGAAEVPSSVLLPSHCTIPDDVGTGEVGDVYRAMKGSALRQEIYSDDGSPLASRPFRVTESKYLVRREQAPTTRRQGAYRAIPSETITHHQERGDSEPRREHQVVLDVNDFGDVVLVASVSFGRTEDVLGDPHDRQRQKRDVVTFTENRYTGAIDKSSRHSFRKPAVCMSRRFQLLHKDDTEAAGEFLRGPDFDPKLSPVVSERLQRATSISVQGATFALLQESRTYFKSGDLSRPLHLGDLDEYSLVGQSFDLVAAGSYLNQVYGSTLEQQNLDLTKVLLQGGYKDLDGDSTWWMPSGTYSHSEDALLELDTARRSFYTPRVSYDPLSNKTLTKTDEFDLLSEGSINALGHVTAALNDYVTLRAYHVVDVNGNRLQALSDCFGRTVAVAQMGKSDETVGDSLDGIPLAPSDVEIAQFFRDPSTTRGSALCKGAGMRRIYDDWAYMRSSSEGGVLVPSRYADIERSSHVSESSTESQFGVSLRYLDGKGEVVQNVQLAEEGRDGSSTWRVSEWSISNNKGDPLRTFQPVLSDTSAFAPCSNDKSPSSTTLYDPLGRIVGKLNPDHTFTKVLLGVWTLATYDEGDNLLVSNAAEDEHVGPYFTTLDAESYLPSWYEQRTQALHDTGVKTPWMLVAARKAEVLNDTPSVLHVDSEGRPILYVTDDGTRKISERYRYDLSGNRTQQIDGRGRIVEKLDHDLLGRVSRRVGMDDGSKYTILDCKGRAVLGWNSQGWCTRTVFDALGRETDVFLRRHGAPEMLIRKQVYDGPERNAVMRNLLGRLYQTFDQSGEYTNVEYDFKGNLTRARRQFLVEYKKIIDWNNDNPRELDEPYEETTEFDAQNRPRRMTDALGAMTLHKFDLMGRLSSVSWKAPGQKDWTAFIKAVSYAADGQPSVVQYGNGTTLENEYDECTRALSRKRLARQRGNIGLEDYLYTYDPEGRVSHMINQAQQSVYFHNNIVDSSNDYTYDALGQLVAAEGRQQVDASNGGGRGFQPWSASRPAAKNGIPGDGQQLCRYRETYEYDEAGNIRKMKHIALDDRTVSGWEKNYIYEEDSLLEGPEKNSNRLSRAECQQETETYAYDGDGSDQSGCISSISSRQTFTWDFTNKLRSSATQFTKTGTPETTWYVYNSLGARVRKVTDRCGSDRQTPTKLKETLYIGNAQAYRKYAGDGKTIKKERHSYHVMAQQRLAVVERDARLKPSNPAAALLVRYTVSDNLELDDQGQVVSYEEFSPFGSPTYSTRRSATEASRKYRFAAYERDKETGLYYCNARMYMPWLGRWLSPDPIGTQDGLNEYCYVHNDPVNYHDPEGTCWSRKLCCCCYGSGDVGNQGVVGVVIARPNRDNDNSNANRNMDSSSASLNNENSMVVQDLPGSHNIDRNAPGSALQEGQRQAVIPWINIADIQNASLFTDGTNSQSTEHTTQAQGLGDEALTLGANLLVQLAENGVEISDNLNQLYHSMPLTEWNSISGFTVLLDWAIQHEDPMSDPGRNMADAKADLLEAYLETTATLQWNRDLPEDSPSRIADERLQLLDNAALAAADSLRIIAEVGPELDMVREELASGYTDVWNNIYRPYD